MNQPPIELKREEIEFYKRETEISSIHKALLLCGNPRLELRRMKKEDFIISLLLLRHALFKLGFTILPIFLMCNILNSKDIPREHMEIDAILINELMSPIQLIHYEKNVTRKSNELFLDYHKENLLDELSMFILIMNQK